MVEQVAQRFADVPGVRIELKYDGERVQVFTGIYNMERNAVGWREPYPRSTLIAWRLRNHY